MKIYQNELVLHMIGEHREFFIKAQLWFALTVFLLCGSLAPWAEACMICVPYPKTTIADRLLLGQSQHPDDVAYIRQKVETAAANGFDKNLSAWVTAFIETHPDTGVEEIAKLYFSNKSRKADELHEVCKGLSVLGSEAAFSMTPKLVDRRHRIVDSHGTLLENHYFFVSTYQSRHLLLHGKNPCPKILSGSSGKNGFRAIRSPGGARACLLQGARISVKLSFA